jgi:hypothetical protein
MYKIYNGKIFEKTNSAIIQVAKYCLEVVENAKVFLQPPSYAHISLIS